MSENSVNQAFDLARQRYADIGVSIDTAIATLSGIGLSIHCW